MNVAFETIVIYRAGLHYMAKCRLKFECRLYLNFRIQ